jgi:cardiolipin synthase
LAALTFAALPFTFAGAMRMELLVDYAAFWERLREDLTQARQSVLVQTFSFEGDATGLALADALRAANLPDTRILVDSFARFVLSDKFLYAPHHWFDRDLRAEKRATQTMSARLIEQGAQIRFTNPPRFGARSMLARNHKKLVLIDDSIAYFGGINFSDHNAAWHDLMLRVEDADAARFLRDDFLATWDGRNSLASASFPALELHTVDGRDNPSKFARVLDLIAAAREEIYVASPYITFPFYEALSAARARGVRVAVVTPAANNWRLFSDYARWEAARTGLDLRFYARGMSHLKALLVDKKWLVVGSSNFDYLSYRLHQELIAVVTAPEVIGQFCEQVAQPDLAASHPAAAFDGAGRWLGWKIKAAAKLLRWLCD